MEATHSIIIIELFSCKNSEQNYSFENLSLVLSLLSGCIVPFERAVGERLVIRAVAAAWYAMPIRQSDGLEYVHEWHFTILI